MLSYGSIWIEEAKPRIAISLGRDEFVFICVDGRGGSSPERSFK